MWKNLVKLSCYFVLPTGATLIQMAPQDVMLPEGTEAKFTCTATTDPEEIQNLRLYWMKDGVEIDYAVRRITHLHT